MPKEIKLTKGYVAVVDDEDYERVSQFNWYADAGKWTVYAARTRKSDRKCVRLHNEIMGNDPGAGRLVDHKDGNGLNNQKSNLRKCSLAENLRNTKKRANTLSVYKGVSYIKANRKWFAQITCADGKHRYIGSFLEEKDAAVAYNAAASREFGEFARLNEIG